MEVGGEGSELLPCATSILLSLHWSSWRNSQLFYEAVKCIRSKVCQGQYWFDATTTKNQLWKPPAFSIFDLMYRIHLQWPNCKSTSMCRTKSFTLWTRQIKGRQSGLEHVELFTSDLSTKLSESPQNPFHRLSTKMR